MQHFGSLVPASYLMVPLPSCSMYPSPQPPLHFLLFPPPPSYSVYQYAHRVPIWLYGEFTVVRLFECMFGVPCRPWDLVGVRMVSSGYVFEFMHHQVVRFPVGGEVKLYFYVFEAPLAKSPVLVPLKADDVLPKQTFKTFDFKTRPVVYLQNEPLSDTEKQWKPHADSKAVDLQKQEEEEDLELTISLVITSTQTKTEEQEHSFFFAAPDLRNIKKLTQLFGEEQALTYYLICVEAADHLETSRSYEHKQENRIFMFYRL